MAEPKKHRLSKSRYLTGLQCHKRLWLEVHEPHAPELVVGDAQQAVFDTGHRVGERAQEVFGQGTSIEVERGKGGDAIAATKEALDRGDKVIFEASFSEDDVFVAVDVLSWESEDADATGGQPTGGHLTGEKRGGWVISEVKSTSRVKDQHVPDAAVQAHVLEKAGLSIKRLELMHLNTAHRHPDDGPLFNRSDVTERAAAHRPEVTPNIRALLAALAGPEPVVDPGDHCTSPYECPFISRCCEDLPKHSIYELTSIKSSKKKLAKLEGDGIETIDQIPGDFPLNPLHSRHRRAVKSGKLVVEDGLAKALAEFEYPIAMLDFETVRATLPVWNGTRPFQQVPVQFSVHTVHEDSAVHENGAVEHCAFLGEPGEDPREALSEALIQAVAGASTILAWHVSFERDRIKELAEDFPAHRDALLAITHKLHDLKPVVKKHVYHPAFHGSFSIKSVVPALLPHLSYDKLEVADGGTASNALEVLLTTPEQVPADERAQLRERLLAYCNHDTLVMVELWKWLNEASQTATVSVSQAGG